MPDPLAPLVFQKVYQDTDSAIVENFNIPGTTYVLGSGLSPAYPSGALLIPKGAGPYADLGAPTAGATYTTGDLVTNGNYFWAVSLVTDWGETKPSATLHIAALGASVKGQTLNLPGYTGRADNPPRKIRIWRTTSGGSQLYLVAELGDLSVSEYVDELDDSELTVTAPTSNTSGMIGIGAVDVYDGATHWTEVGLGTTLTTKHFSVDYTVTATGGTVHFAGADIGTNVTVTYFAGTFLGSAYLNQYWTALAGVWEWARTDATAVFSHSLQITTDLEVLGNTDLDGTLDVASTSTFNALLTTSSLHVTGTSVLDGIVTMGSNATIAGTLAVTGTLDVTGNATFHGTLNVTGLATLSGGLSTTGGGSFSGNVSIGGTLTVTGSTTLNGGLGVSSGGTISGGFTVNGGETINGGANFIGPSKATFGGGIDHGLDIAGSGAEALNVHVPTTLTTLTVTDAGATALQVSGTSDLNDVHIANPKTLFTNYIDSETSTLVTVNQELAVLARLHPTRILCDKGSSAQVLSGQSSGAGGSTAFVGSHNDFGGLIHYHIGATPTSGAQFTLSYSSSTLHAAIPGVIITVTYTGGHTVGAWYVSASDNFSFVLIAETAPTAGDDIYISYAVMN